MSQGREERRVRYALHRVKPLGGRLVTEVGTDFDERSYSRFKHGDGTLAARYGRALAGGLLAATPHLVTPGAPLVVTSAPYKYLPTASHALAQEVCRSLNRATPAGSGRGRGGGGRHGRRLAETGTLRMSRVPPANYARMDVDRRAELLAESGLRVGSGHFAGRNVVLVDDARVTGLAETTTRQLLRRAGARSVTPVYVVVFVEDHRAVRPELEHRINQAYVRDLWSLLDVIRGERFVLNIRTVKFVLGWPDLDELDAFLTHLTGAELRAIHDAACGTGPEFARDHAEPLRRLRAALERTEAAQEPGPPDPPDPPGPTPDPALGGARG